jgi:hypothetical protein
VLGCGCEDSDRQQRPGAAERLSDLIAQLAVEDPELEATHSGQM